MQSINDKLFCSALLLCPYTIIAYFFAKFILKMGIQVSAFVVQDYFFAVAYYKKSCYAKSSSPLSTITSKKLHDLEYFLWFIHFYQYYLWYFIFIFIYIFCIVNIFGIFAISSLSAIISFTIWYSYFFLLLFTKTDIDLKHLLISIQCISLYLYSQPLICMFAYMFWLVVYTITKVYLWVVIN